MGPSGEVGVRNRATGGKAWEEEEGGSLGLPEGESRG